MYNNDNYSAHAAIWDWGGVDRTNDFEYWRKSAARYGRDVLIPFCALGECGAYMARHGFEVTAFDITPEMISEGKKRFGELSGLHLYTADITNFHFDGLQADFCFIDGDFGHIHTLDGVKNALRCICAQLREGGGLVIETELPVDKSSYTPPKTFYPKKQVYADKKVWKVGDGRSEVETGRLYISQTVYVENANGDVTQFDHSFYLQSYTREEWLNPLTECGFEIRSEYCGRGHAPWNNGDGEYCIEAIKKRTYPIDDSEVIYILRQYKKMHCTSHVEWITVDNIEQLNCHRKLCGKNIFSETRLHEICLGGDAEYCLLYIDELPIARGAIERYSNGMWEAADIYVAQEYRGQGYGKEILQFISKEIITRGRIASCRTERDNMMMRKVMEAIGYYIDGGNESHSFVS